MNNWVQANSSHVLDAAFFIAGLPKKLNGVTFNKTSRWRKNGIRFLYHGIGTNNLIFEITSDWRFKGAWIIFFETNNKKYLLSPLEIFYDISNEPVLLNEDLNNYFKNGFPAQIDDFMNKKLYLLKINKYFEFLNIYEYINTQKKNKF